MASNSFILIAIICNSILVLSLIGRIEMITRVWVEQTKERCCSWLTRTEDIIGNPFRSVTNANGKVDFGWIGRIEMVTRVWVEQTKERCCSWLIQARVIDK